MRNAECITLQNELGPCSPLSIACDSRSCPTSWANSCWWDSDGAQTSGALCHSSSLFYVPFHRTLPGESPGCYSHGHAHVRVSQGIRQVRCAFSNRKSCIHLQEPPRLDLGSKCRDPSRAHRPRRRNLFVFRTPRLVSFHHRSVHANSSIP